MQIGRGKDMLEFMILMTILYILSKIPVGKPEPNEEYNPYKNGSADIYIKNNSWEFDSLDDAMEFRELRATGWRGNAGDFYRWKGEE